MSKAMPLLTFIINVESSNASLMKKRGGRCSLGAMAVWDCN